MRGFFNLERFLKILVVLACLGAGCGVKKYPDLYTHRPMRFEDASPTPTMTPAEPTPTPVFGPPPHG